MRCDCVCLTVAVQIVRMSVFLGVMMAAFVTRAVVTYVYSFTLGVAASVRRSPIGIVVFAF